MEDADLARGRGIVLGAKCGNYKPITPGAGQGARCRPASRLTPNPGQA